MSTWPILDRLLVDPGVSAVVVCSVVQVAFTLCHTYCLVETSRHIPFAGGAPNCLAHFELCPNLGPLIEPALFISPLVCVCRACGWAHQQESPA